MHQYESLQTRQLIALMKTKGHTIKKLSELSGVSISVLYHYNIGQRISEEREAKIRDIVLSLIKEDD